jgi:large subunit ribosomal protein L21
VDYAVIRTGGLQYKVSEGDLIRVPSLQTEVGEKLDMDEVLAVNRGGDMTVGTPLVEGAKVSAEVVRHGRAAKIVVYKKKRRKGYQRKKGHRQGFTELRISTISA